MCVGALIAQKIGVKSPVAGAATSPMASVLGAFNKKKQTPTGTMAPTSAPTINTSLA